MYLKIGMSLIFSACLLIPSIAQVTNFEAEGNLEPTQNPGCISVAEAENNLAPPDLVPGIRDCVADEEFGKAIELIVVMQLRANYDMKRVLDRTAHQASTVIGMQVFGAMSEPQKAKISTAGEAFGETGSKSHNALCALMRETGPPDYVPTYMIQHGTGAFTGTNADPLVEGFDPSKAWPELLVTYLKC